VDKSKETGVDREPRRGRCPSCQILVINGILTHKVGCPNAYRDEVRECKWCGVDFQPEFRAQIFCSPDCGECYYT
jgi:hypothetical protein